MTLLHPLLQRAVLAYGAGATLAGALTFAFGLGDAWSLLGSGAGALIVARALRLLRRTFAMQARTLEELEFRRIVLGIGTLAAVFGTRSRAAIRRQLSTLPGERAALDP